MGVEIRTITDDEVTAFRDTVFPRLAAAGLRASR